MRRTVTAAVLSVGMIAIGAAPAGAASTRAEYIAQVDPICQSFVGPMGSAWAAYLRNGRRAERHLKQGTYKSWVRLIRRTGSSLNHLAQTRTSMVDQIAAVPATASDAATVTGWLNYVRQETAYESSAAASLRGLRIGNANKKSARANGAEQAAKRTISGFGFQVCGLGVLA